MTTVKNQVRNCAELGPTLREIVDRLLKNQNLMKLLYYTGKDPLSEPDIDEHEIDHNIYNHLVRLIPRTEPFETAHSVIAVKINKAITNPKNSEFRVVSFTIEVFVPLEQWFIKDENLRPFAILGEIQKTLNGKKIGNIGEVEGGDFINNYNTDEISAYEQYFSVMNYN